MKVCEVSIYGQTYSLRAEMDEVEMRRIAALVDERMRDVASAAPSASPLQVAVLAALDLVGERSNVAAQAAQAVVPKEMDSRLDAMLNLLDGVTADGELA